METKDKLLQMAEILGKISGSALCHNDGIISDEKFIQRVKELVSGI